MGIDESRFDKNKPWFTSKHPFKLNCRWPIKGSQAHQFSREGAVRSCGLRGTRHGRPIILSLCVAVTSSRHLASSHEFGRGSIPQPIPTRDTGFDPIDGEIVIGMPCETRSQPPDGGCVRRASFPSSVWRKTREVL